jgi:hypothetical protein
MFSRQIFNIDGSSSAFSDTGPHFSGAIMQMRWYPTTADTGADLAIDLMPSAAAADTGQAYTFYNNNDCLGTAFTHVPTQPQHHSDGFDTGASSDVPIVAAGERLRVRITPGGSAVAGKLYIWTAD